MAHFPQRQRARRMKRDPILSSDRNGAIEDVHFPTFETNSLRRHLSNDDLGSRLRCACRRQRRLGSPLLGGANERSECDRIERHPSPPDKACGECLMPSAVSALNRLGVLDLNRSAVSASIDGIRFKREGAASAEARLPSPGGLGVRRIELTAAMMYRARLLGAEIHERTSVRGYRVQQDQVLAETDVGPLRARFLAAADGLHSRLRSMAGLRTTSRRPRRFGIRQHFRVKPWSRFVEVHFADGVEAFVTPVGPRTSERRVSVGRRERDAAMHSD